jgi:hypothetical protein
MRAWHLWALAKQRTISATVIGVIVLVIGRDARGLLSQRRVDKRPRAAAALQHARASRALIQQLRCGDC